jgi:DNA replication protein DnaC
VILATEKPADQGLPTAQWSLSDLAARIRQAGFPVHKDFDTYDFTATPALNKPKLLELARGEWIEQRYNLCLIGNAGTGKSQPT